MNSLFIFFNKTIISNKFLKYTTFWYWFRWINHSGWRMDDHHRYLDFWNSINVGYHTMNYEWEYKNKWGKK